LEQIEKARIAYDQTMSQRLKLYSEQNQRPLAKLVCSFSIFLSEITLCSSGCVFVQRDAFILEAKLSAEVVARFVFGAPGAASTPTPTKRVCLLMKFCTFLALFCFKSQFFFRLHHQRFLAAPIKCQLWYSDSPHTTNSIRLLQPFLEPSMF
jgi:hypothetical protein